nr:MAG TPA: RRXRR protein [Bacteriophage sp.]
MVAIPRYRSNTRLLNERNLLMVFVLDKSKKPLDMITNVKARILLRNNLAVIHKVYPFTIRLIDNSCGSRNRAYTVKFDPGSKHTGIAIVDNTNKVVMLAELEHRGHLIKRNLDKRRAVRRSRRQRNTRYRPARFLNRTRPEGWLAPSIKSRSDNLINFIIKYKKLINITKVMIEHVSFDTAQMSSDTDLNKTDYQKGPLYNTNLRDFIFSKTNHKCSYCGAPAQEIDHIVPRAKGGTNSTHNLTPVCRSCNEKKSNLSLKEFGKLMNKDYSHLEPKKLPKDAAIIQAARNYTITNIRKIIPDTTSHDAWLTKYNKENLNLPKEHYYDALSVGEIPNKFDFSTDKILLISAKGRGSRQMCSMNKYGFPRTASKGSKSVKGFQTGDFVKAVVTKGKKQGTYLGRVTITSKGYFGVDYGKDIVEGVCYKYCRLIQKGDGYLYKYNKTNNQQRK